MVHIPICSVIARSSLDRPLARAVQKLHLVAKEAKLWLQGRRRDSLPDRTLSRDTTWVKLPLRTPRDCD